jgi:uncharacterized protein (TIGR03000 family)
MTALVVVLALLLTAAKAAGEHRRAPVVIHGGSFHTYVAPRPTVTYHGGYYAGYHRYHGFYYPRTYYPGGVYYGYTPLYYYYSYTPSVTVYPYLSVPASPFVSTVPATVTPTPSSPAVELAPMPTAADVAYIHVRVPADAVLWLNGERMSGTGTERRFVSPPLVPGKSYTYEVRARWSENGRPIERVRHVTVLANETTTVDFTVAASS